MKRLIRWVLGALIVFEIVYVLAGIVLVRSGQVERWINKHPEKLKITFDSAWTFIPGLAHLGGVRVVNQGRGNQLEAVVDKARVFVNPFALISKRVQASGFRAQGVEFRYRKRPKTAEEAAEKADSVPPIEGAPFEPYSGPPKQEKKEGEEKKPGWAIDVRSSDISDVREVWMGAFRLRGSGNVAASVLVETGDGTKLSIRSADVRYDRAEFSASGEPYSEDLKIHVDGKMEPFNTKETKGKAIMGLITASVELSGNSTGQLLNYYFGNADWLKFKSQPRQMSAKLDVDHGKLKPGGYFDLEKGPLGAEFAGFITEGDAGARLDTVPAKEGGGADVQVKVEFSDYGMRRLAEGPPIMKGAGLLIDVRSPADLEQIPPDDFEGQIQLGTAEYPDLTFVNEMLPGGRGLVKSGRGSVGGGFEIGEKASVHGGVKIKTLDLIVQTGGVETSGNVEVTIEVPDGNLNELLFGLDNTRIEFADFDFKSQAAEESLPPWKGHLTVTEGTLDLGEERGVDVKLDLGFTDTRPLVAFLSQDKPLKGWQENLLMIEEIKGEGVAEASPGSATIRHFGVRGEKLDIRFRAAVGPKGAFGKAMAKYGILKAGIGLEGRERDLKILRVGSWYKKDDIPGMPPLLPQYAEPVDVEAEEREALEAEQAEKTPEGQQPPEGEKPPGGEKPSEGDKPAAQEPPR